MAANLLGGNAILVKSAGIRGMTQEEPKTIYAEEQDLTGPPDMRKIERLAQILAQLRMALSELNAESTVITEDDRDMWVKLLRELKIGDLPFDLPPRLRDDVKKLEEEWASEASMTALKGRLSSFLRPLYQEDESLKLDEKELDLEGERLATLKMLADLLDELLKSKPDVPTEEISAEAFQVEKESNSPDQTGNGGKLHPAAGEHAFEPNLPDQRLRLLGGKLPGALLRRVRAAFAAEHQALWSQCAVRLCIEANLLISLFTAPYGAGGGRAQMQQEIHLQTVAHFGKRDGASDYNWLFGKDAVPAELLAVCEQLSNLSASTHALLSVVAEKNDIYWLVRTYFQGTDNSYRPIPAVEVVNTGDLRIMTPEHQLRLAAFGVQPQDRKRAVEPGRFSVILPFPQVGPEPPAGQLLVQIRLGLPVSVPTRVALSLVDYRPWRYRGICFASRSRDGSPPECLPELARYFCINFGHPGLSEDQQAALDAALKREISPDEWRALDRLDAGLAQEALRWSVNPALSNPAATGDELCKDWLLAFRRAEYRGAELLRVLRFDLRPHQLTPSLIRSAASELSEGGAGFLAEAMYGRSPGAGLDVIEELAQKGYLADPNLIPLRFLAPHIAVSPVIAGQALRRLESVGIDRESARFALDLPSERGSFAPRQESAERAIRVAFQNGAPVPRQNVRRLLESAQDEKELWPLEELSQAYGGWAQAVWEMVYAGGIPAQGILALEEMVAVTDLRQRLSGNSWEQLDALSSMVRAGRRDEALAFFESIRSSLAKNLSPAGLQTLEARIGLAAPAALPLPKELSLLVERELARPEDIAPSADGSNLAECARAWPETSALADLLENVGAVLSEVPPEFPDHWKQAVRTALPKFHLKQWVKRRRVKNFESASSPVIFDWIARLYELDPRPFLAFLDGDAAPKTRERVKDLLPWLDLFSGDKPREWRLKFLANIAHDETARGDDQMAQEIAQALLPGDNEESVDFAIHALSKVGPFPSLGEAPPDLVTALAPMVDTLSLIDRIFADTKTTTLSKCEDLVELLLRQVRDRGVVCPEKGYALRVLARHRHLTERLSKVRGWERIAIDPANT